MQHHNKSQVEIVLVINNMRLMFFFVAKTEI